MTKSKYNHWAKRFIPGSPKTLRLTNNTNEMLRHHVGNRKKGHVFINERTEKRTLRLFEKKIDKRARLLNIQKLQSIKPSGKEYHLVTLMALREAGERHHDLKGGNPDVSPKATGHSKETKARYYKKVSYEGRRSRTRDIIRRLWRGVKIQIQLKVQKIAEGEKNYIERKVYRATIGGLRL